MTSGTEWWHEPYWVLSLIVVVVGLVAGVWFCLMYARGVKHFWSLDAFDAGAWVFGLVILYVFAVFGLFNDYKFPAGGAQAISRMGIAVLLDAILVARFVRYLRLVRSANRDGRERPPPELLEESHHEREP